MSWFPIVQGRQQWTLFLCTVWDSLIHHIAFMSLPRTGLSREGEINETGGGCMLEGGQAMEDVKHDWEEMRGQREMELCGRHQGGLTN